MAAGLMATCGGSIYAWQLAHVHVDMGDVPTWIAAAATAAAAFFAALAARAAWRQLTSQAAEQDRVRALQEVQLQQLHRDAAAVRRQQAGQVSAAIRAVEYPLGEDWRTFCVRVANESNRPISSLFCEGSSGSDGSPSGAQRADVHGSDFVRKFPGGVVTSLGASERAFFYWRAASKIEDLHSFCLRFWDDAGVGWELDQDMRLTEALTQDL